MRVSRIIVLSGALIACQTQEAPRGQEPSAPSASPSPSPTASGPSAAPSVAPAPEESAKPSASGNPRALAAGLEREAEHDYNCEGGKKAYSGSTRNPLPDSGCEGPSLVHFTMKDTKTGEMRDGEIPIFCCPD